MTPLDPLWKVSNLLEFSVCFSNTGGNDITQRTLEHWQKGNLRESIQLAEMEEIINVAAFNEEG